MSIVEIIEQSRINRTTISGVVVGIVTNNQDPDGMARVKVRIPRLSGEDESFWARVATLMSGKEKGMFFLPEVDDEVLVAFEHGDINMPYVIGSLWNGVDKPPETNSDGENNIRVIKSRSGHIIRLNDKEGSEKIEIIDKTEKNMFVIDTKENTISITSDKDINISASNGKVKIEAKDIEIKASSSAKVESGAGMDLKASAAMNIKGSAVNIN